MQTHQVDYFAAYRGIKLKRDTSGVLIVKLHNNGKPLVFTAQDHTEFVDAFYRISQDLAGDMVDARLTYIESADNVGNIWEQRLAGGPARKTDELCIW